MNTRPAVLDDAALRLQTRALVVKQCETTAELLAVLAEVDLRRAYADWGHPSMHSFCTDELGMSDDVAYNSVNVARCSRVFPVILDELKAGRLHLSGLRMLSPHLTQENHLEVLAEARGKTKAQLDLLIARLAPRPPVPDSIRKLPQRVGAPEPATTVPSPQLFDTVSVGQAASPSVGVTPSVVQKPSAEVAAAVVPRPAVAPASMKPLSEETFKVTFTASKALRQKLEQAQGLLSHSVAPADLASVVERALDLLIAQTLKKRFGVGAKVRGGKSESKPAEVSCPHPNEALDVGPAANDKQDVSAEAAADSDDALVGCGREEEEEASTRHIPMHIRRAVYERDGGRCTYVFEGRRCKETRNLEYDHIKGWANTHQHSVDGIRLACRMHNQRAADWMYGRDFMDRARQRVRPGANDDVGMELPRAEQELLFGAT
jgi:hypothetical protein